ncbi:hypothetical protein [Streptomyces sp. Ru73]|uniref:hypothetical protein n=1 Tax=Streptomyces sp. Ru73 TaxID=2080748 RepID=UPI0027E40D96|nr:hypothetical protein [Streptomyces sp. Ru73]
MLHRLEAVDHDLPVYLAINPDWPYAHRVAEVMIRADGHTGAAYIAEDGQMGALPLDVRTALSWS